MYRRIRDLREDRDLLQRDLAAYLQCSQVCYSHYEMGKRDIPTDAVSYTHLSPAAARARPGCPSPTPARSCRRLPAPPAQTAGR